MYSVVLGIMTRQTEMHSSLLAVYNSFQYTIIQGLYCIKFA